MKPLTRIQWLICTVAAFGFAFDSYELLMLPLIVQPALIDLTGYAPGSADLNRWVGLMFFVPAVCAGIFGLMGGLLVDRFGRKRLLVWSILLYAFSACAAGYSTSASMLLALRSATFVGVSLEFVAAVAWLAELFPDPRQREKVIGTTQLFHALGGIMATGSYYLVVTYGPMLPVIQGTHEPWRYMLISGVIPALPLMLIRPFLPESPIWQEKKLAGTLKRPSLAELFQPALRRTTLITALMVAMTYGAASGALQQVPRIVPGLDTVRELSTTEQQQTATGFYATQEFGALAGRMLLAFLAIRIIQRRRLLRVFQVPGLIVVPLAFLFAAAGEIQLFMLCNFAMGAFTLGQASFWGNYLPRVYPTHLRGTGESFAHNVGGRMLGTTGAVLTTQLTNIMPGGTPTLQLAYACAVVGFSVYLIGLIASFFLPEPAAHGQLPE